MLCWKELTQVIKTSTHVKSRQNMDQILTPEKTIIKLESVLDTGDGNSIEYGIKQGNVQELPIADLGIHPLLFSYSALQQYDI